MKDGFIIAAVLALLLTVPACAPAAEPPQLTLDHPLPGAVLLNGTVEINGTARGSCIDWLETLHEDFEPGTLVNLTNDGSGTLMLNRSMYDTFDGSAIDPARWTADTSVDFSANVGGGRLQLTGSAQTDDWTSYARVLSTAKVSGTVNGTLSQFMEVGTGAYSAIGLHQDDQNYIMLGRGFDFFGMGPGQRIVVVSSVSGCFTMESLGQIDNAPHAFVVSYDGSQATLYMDGNQVGTRNIALGDARCIIQAQANASGDFVSALWDDISCLYFTHGHFLSAVHDTLSGAPEVQSVAWTATVPPGMAVGVRLRSADDPAMAGASDWAQVTSGQSSGFPAFRRYMQYEVQLNCPAGNGTPLFRDIVVRYICDIKTVEVSIDNRATWTPATGGANWTVTLEIPDGPRMVWARVTDVSGDVQVTSVSFDIDTTPPAASLLINDGAELTARPEVNLTLSASDAYGLDAMMLSEDPVFEDTQWQPYAKSLDWNLSAGDGEKTVYFKARDKNGWESDVASASVTLDTSAPAGTIRINDGAAYTKTTSVRLALNATDNMGVADMLLSNRADFSGDDWLPYSPSFPWQLQPGNGVRNVYARFRDGAGHMSKVASATITLDTVPPEFTFSIENGSAFATSYTVELQLNATDNYALGQAMVSTQPQFSGATWQPWAASVRFTLPPDEGPVNLYAKVRDEAGNEASSQTASTVVDTVAPLCVVSSLPATVAQEAFAVSWNGNDATSGVTGYDIQYRDGTGPWTDWLLLFQNTTAVFTGQDGHTYTFRARAHDLAGNVGLYPDNPRTTTTVRLPGGGSRLPVVTILTPESSAPVKGNVKLEGTARALAPGRTVQLVQWQVDDGPWRDATGTENWSLTWDTSKVPGGAHTIRVRSFDGQDHSTVAERTFNVDNPVAVESGSGTDLLPVLAVLAIVIVAGAVGGFLVMKRKRRVPEAPAPTSREPATAGPPRPPADTAGPDRPITGPEVREAAGVPEGEAAAGGEAAGAVAEAEPVPPGEGEPPVAAPVAEPAGEVPAGEPAEARPEEAPARESALPPLQSTPRPPLEFVRQVDPARIQPVVQAILPTLPAELQFMQPEVLVQLVVTGEQGKSKFGEPLVLIMGRWYFADESKPHFLQRYNW